MPDEALWEALFDVSLILDRLGVEQGLRDVVELGCGYGTFTLPVARRISGTLTTLGIEPRMVERSRQRATASGLANIRVLCRDVLQNGLRCEAESEDACLLFQS
ncbi:MAG: methyltransferase domain-containing protein [Verrucomicrobiales bacterium]|nr:methyltransferase domain-containing protein [Verrucomicrobiales bacterium]